MSSAKAIFQVTSLLDTPAMSQEMIDLIQEYQSVKSGIPKEISWVVDGLLCGLVFPMREHLKYLVNNNVAYLVCLSREEEPDVTDFPDLVTVDLKQPCDTLHLDQIVEFVTLVELAQLKKKAVAVCCSDGLETAGTLLACYLVQTEMFTAEEAIQKVCDQTPGSVRLRTQEVLIAEYETYRKKVPPRFSWVVKDRLCAMAFPEHQENLQYLVDHGVGYLICLTNEGDPDAQDFPDLCKVDIKMSDFSCPRLDQVTEFMSIMDRSAQEHKAVAVHCAGGRGRTGTMISCYLMQDEGMTAGQAIRHIRELRPGSVETTDQQKFIYDFEKTIRQVPDNFLWVVDDLLCTLAFPESRQNLQYLVDNNVAYLVSLTADRDPPIRLCPELELVSLKIQDFTSPSIHQVEEFLNVLDKAGKKKQVEEFLNVLDKAGKKKQVEEFLNVLDKAGKKKQVEEFLNVLDKAGKKKQAVALHCSQGQGCTGAMIACYLVKVEGLTAADAIEKTRLLKHGSIETKEQEKLVHDFVKYLNHMGLSESL